MMDEPSMWVCPFLLHDCVGLKVTAALSCSCRAVTHVLTTAVRPHMPLHSLNCSYSLGLKEVLILFCAYPLVLA